MSDLDDEELESTRKLHGVSKKSDIEILEEMIKRDKETLYEFDITNDEVEAIENLIEENKEYKRQLDLRYDEFINRDRWE